MEKVSSIFLLFLAVLFHDGQAQETKFVRAGLISVRLTLSPGHMFSDQQTYFYLHGNLEGYVSPTISLVGENYINLGSFAGDGNAFDHHHSLFFGASKHFTGRNTDFYLGLQPGLGFTQLNAAGTDLPTTRLGVNPLFSPLLGFNFYVHQYMHFFVQSRLILGQHHYDVPRGLAEVRFSAGLGFNLHTLRP